MINQWPLSTFGSKMNCLRNWFWVACLLHAAVVCHAQSPVIALLSDTQEPFGIEKALYGNHKNTIATARIFADIIQHKPAALFLLGDVVAVGDQENRWKKMDVYLDSVRQQNTRVQAVLGNHDLLFSAAKGEAVFRKRFPGMVNTGSVEIVDSIAFIMLNSNFKQLAQHQRVQQDSFYQRMLEKMDKDDAVKFVIVTCHHSPYSNSQVVGSNKRVQESFVKPFQRAKKAKLFISGHAHDFEHFRINDKDFLTIGGGGGVHHPLNNDANRIRARSYPYDPEFHYLLIRRDGGRLLLISRRLLTDFSGFEDSYRFTVQ